MHVLGTTDDFNPVTPGRFTTSEPCTEENEADGFLGLRLQVFMVHHGSAFGFPEALDAQKLDIHCHCVVPVGPSGLP